MSENNSSSGRVGFCGLLTIAFIVLQLCSVIHWSWWWVLSPIWIPFALAVIINMIKIDNKPASDSKTLWQQRMEKMKRQKENQN